MTDAEQLSRVREILQEVAARGATITYRELADELDVGAPHVIQQVAGLLERTMREDAAVGEPFLAAVVVGRARGLPRHGFFEQARALGRFHGEPGGREAAEFHRDEYRAVVAAWGVRRR